MYKSKFTMDALEGATFEGWTDGSDWNGWATPWFEFAEAVKLAEHFNKLEWEPAKKAWFDPQSDGFCFIPDNETEPECYSGEMVKVGNKTIKLYPIGTRVWIWEEATVQMTSVAR